MKRLPAAALIALVLMLMAAAIGISLRTAATTINYPNYSSFNNKELGLRAYYETARRLGIPVERNYRSLMKFEGTRGTVVYANLIVGDLRYADPKVLELYERVAKPGTRLMFLMNVHEENYVRTDETTAENADDDDAEPDKATHDSSKQKDGKSPGAGNPANKKQGNKPTTGKERDENLSLRWGVEMKPVDTPRNVGPLGQIIDDQLGHVVDRRWTFAKWNGQWKPTAGADGQVYMLERTFGSGAVVILLGLENFTNKTLLTKVDSARIASTLSGPRPLIFDESHLGVADDDTVAGFARQHNLEWLLLGLLVLAGLYVWRSSVSFVPALPEIRGAEIPGREAHAALTSLLSQSIKRPDLPPEIVAAWRETFRMLPSSKVHVTDESLEAFAVARDSEATLRYAAVSQSATRRRTPS